MRRFVAVVAATGLAFAGTMVAASAAQATSPTIRLLPTTGGPGQYVEVTGTNWTANDTVTVTIDTVYMCNVTPGSTGAIEATVCSLPDVPYGSRKASAAQSATGLTASTTIAIVPAISYLSSGNLSPGNSTTVNAAGYKAGVAFKAYLDSTTSTPLTTSPAAVTTSSSGAVSNVAITIPSGASVGSHSLILDASGDTTSTPITVYQPTLTLSATSGRASSYVSVSGTGWRPEDGVNIDIGPGGLCGITSNSSGAISSVCTVPDVVGGSETVTANQDGGSITVAPFTFKVTPSVTYNAYPAVSPGNTVEVAASGLAATSAITASLTGVSGHLTVSPANPTTDGNGNTGYLTITIPTSVKTGAKTLTLSDAASDTATTTVDVYKPTFTLNVSSSSPTDYVLMSGTGFAPNVGIGMTLDGSGFCGTTANATGAFSGYCQIPAVPAGSQSLVLQQDSSQVTVTKSLKIVPGIYNNIEYPDVTAGASITIPNAYGFKASSDISATLSGVSGKLTTNPATPSTDSTGSLSSTVVTIPTGVSVGNHTLTLSDGTNTATATISVYAPTLTFTEESGASGTYYAVNGSGLWANNGLYIYFGSTDTCGLNVNGSGVINSYCQVPNLSAGSYAVSAQQDNGAIDVALPNFTVTSS
jgi:hypothetical protein